MGCVYCINKTLAASFNSTMQDCYEIKKTDELVKHLKSNGRTDPYEDFDYQLQTNYAWVFELKNGQVVLIGNSFRHGGLIFRDKECFNQTVNADKFPIENPDKSLYDIEIDRIKSINKQIDIYREHLNTVLKFDFQELTREAAQAYIKKVVGRTIKKLTTDTDLVALIAIFGEIMRREIKGKWVLEKWYGTFNPYFMPKILNPNNKIIPINDSLLTAIKWKVTDVEHILNNTEGVLSLKQTKEYHECIVLTD